MHQSIKPTWLCTNKSIISADLEHILVEYYYSPISTHCKEERRGIIPSSTVINKSDLQEYTNSSTEKTSKYRISQSPVENKEKIKDGKKRTKAEYFI